MPARPDLASLREQVSDGAAGAVIRRVWKHPRLGPVTRVVGSYLALYAVLHLALSNPPPAGVVVFGALIGLLYGMVALGLILIYRANRIINFAQAEMGAVAAVLAVLLIKVQHVPYLVAFVIAMVAAVLSGWLVELLIVRRFASAPRLVLSVATIGVALIFAVLQFYMPKWIGGDFLVDPSPPKTPFSGLSFTINPLIFDANSIVIVFAAVVVVVGLTLFFRYTDIGMAVRAAAENADRAKLLGISTNRLSSIVWMLGTALSALGVFLRIPVIGLPIGADIGPYVLLYSLAAAVIARMEVFSVALAAGVAIGVLEQSLYYSTHDQSIASAVMLPILLGAMLLQRRKLSRGEDSGLATWSLAAMFRPTPPELRPLAEVQWGRLGLGVVAIAAAVLLPFITGLEQQILASVVVIYGMVAVSLVMLTGWAGQISLGQWGFAGVGALITSAVGLHLHGDFFITVLLSGLAGAVASVLIGLPALRIQGLYLAVTTLAFGIAVQVYLLSPSYFPSLLPGGVEQIVRPRLFGQYSIDDPKNFYLLTLGFLVLSLLSARALRNSRAGRVMIAARDNERGAQSYGISVPMARLSAFALSGFWAAIAGSLFAYDQQTVQVGAFDPQVSLLLLSIVVIGGVTSLPGAMLGTLFIGGLKYGGLSAQAQLLTSGAGVLFLLYVVPGGLAQWFYGARDAMLRKLAERKGILVPSLVADTRDVTVTDPHQEEDVLLAATASVELAGRRRKPPTEPAEPAEPATGATTMASTAGRNA